MKGHSFGRSSSFVKAASSELGLCLKFLELTFKLRWEEVIGGWLYQDTGFYGLSGACQSEPTFIDGRGTVHK